MSILQKLKKVKKEHLIQKHPFAGYDISFRYGYAIGCGMIAAVDGSIHKEEIDAIEALVLSLGLPEEYVQKVVEIAPSAGKEIVEAILDSMHEKREKYVFILDLYKTVSKTGMLQAEEKVISLFMEMFELKEVEQVFLREFFIASCNKSNEDARKALQEAYNNNLEPPFETLKYFLPELAYREEVIGRELTNGQRVKLSKPCLLQGQFIVKAGAELDISDTEVVFGDNASIIVEGGFLKADRARLIATRSSQATLLQVKNVVQLEFNHLYVDGCSSARALQITNSVIKIRDSHFENCRSEENGGVIFCSDSRLIIDNTKFLNTEAIGCGGAIFEIKSQCHLYKCTFLMTKAVYGGAVRLGIANQDVIYMSEPRYKVTSCSFEGCSALASGGAIYLHASVENFRQGVSKGTFADNTFCRCEALEEAGGIYISRYTAYDHWVRESAMKNFEGEWGTFVDCRPNDIY